MERLKDDPFYLMDNRQGNSKKPEQDDIDNIPVVQLDDLPPLSQGTAYIYHLSTVIIVNSFHSNPFLHSIPVQNTNSHLPKLKSNPSDFSRQVFVIDKVGEMPEGAVSPPPVAREAPPSIGNGTTGRSTPILSSFPQYEVEDEISRTSTPPPIKVTRVKKKTKTAGSSSGTSSKKKRTTDHDSSRISQ